MNESVRYERRDAQNQSCYAVFHRLTGRKLGTVRRLLDGHWMALRGSGPAALLVHSPGHATRAAAARELT